ncbi:glutathione S-transferase [Ottowia thiooxydans]|uniref:Glutathione S-transferase n=2 Tax=Ottowia thiooxydans TaxID=219182 RepID=A0ABV2Q8Z2_9BURK
MAFPPKLTLYFSPKACSLASHIALEESRLLYEAVSVDIRAQENMSPAYLKINPSGAVPALGIGDAVLTESHAILTYIADLAPESGLLPRPGTLARVRAHEWMNWISGTMHVTYRSIFRSQTYAGDEPHAIAAVREHAKKKLAKVLREVEDRLGTSDYAVGGQFSVVDAYLFVFYTWSFDERIQTKLPDRPRYAALAERVFARPAVRRVLARERAVRAYELPPSFAQALSEAQ